MKRSFILFITVCILFVFACPLTNAEESSTQTSQDEYSSLTLGTPLVTDSFTIEFSEVHISKPLRTDDGKVMNYFDCGENSYYVYYSGSITNNTDGNIDFSSILGKIYLNGTEGYQGSVIAISKFGYIELLNMYNSTDHITPNDSLPFFVYTTVSSDVLSLIDTVSLELGFNSDLSKPSSFEDCQNKYTNITNRDQIILPNHDFIECQIDQPTTAAQLELIPTSFTISDEAKVGSRETYTDWDKMVLAEHATITNNRSSSLSNPCFTGEVIVNDQYTYELESAIETSDLAPGDTCEIVFYGQIPVDISNIVEKAEFKICFDNDLNSHIVYSMPTLEYENQLKIVWNTTPLLASKTNEEIAVTEPLKRGDKGEGVRKMQKYLIALGFLNGEADGDFGKGTERALRDFQQAEGLEETGIADTKTLETLFSKEIPVLPDISITVRKIKENHGTTELYLQLTNNTERTIDRVDFLVVCYNVYGEIIESYDMYQRTACHLSDETLEPGKTSSSDWYWSIYDTSGTSRVEIALTKYHFKDAETVAISEEEYNWLSFDKE